MLLILSNTDDLAVDFLITELERRGLPYFRLNSDEIDSCSYHVTRGYDEKGPLDTINTGHKKLFLQEVTAVWYRRAVRPNRLGRSASVSAYPDFTAMELRHLVEGIAHSLPAETCWVNAIHATEKAERKIFQLEIAPSCGFRIPKTIVSTDGKTLKQFAQACGRVICKPISQGLVADKSGWHAAYAREVTATELPEIDTGRDMTPTLFQELVPKGLDVRVTVIGQDIFAVGVETAADDGIDWRANSKTVSYKVMDVPGSVKKAILTLMNRLGLSYGAFDFVRSPDEDWYFLEVNPAGEWAWLEVELGLQMRDAFIRLFTAQRA